jgi:hypothetical protein
VETSVAPCDSSFKIPQSAACRPSRQHSQCLQLFFQLQLPYPIGDVIDMGIE